MGKVTAAGSSVLMARALLLGLLLAPAPALAQTLNPFARNATISLVQNQPLRFGTFAVLGQGSKTVGAAGNITEQGLVSFGRDPVAPAEFTLTWQRNNATRFPVTVVVQLSYGASAPVTINGITGQITSYESDLGGLSTINPGGNESYTFLACAAATCSVRFRVGGRLAISAGSDGAQLTMPVPLTARIMAEL